ncbi:hypothetical protein SPRG_00910 [Saprolegnia parasitica CBS 223.65]|uniref:Major facilitator superfamily (MFS) profile domain-containing protein n=1 Tax=Saprolegnia parasitica (strain CBS 223.65) TaxID=695850 RepID=A0A067CVX1_SAPPC|nr:hypothetical protein SPRG_00910 [Saprolegnia parasitica CBS 223.65]KDO34849.1 hypothetical protein SPRG_00910 [Saprolegnia parasitica CBS 223.65]|eukprot:XP_012194512.1 hypothetical protein SPRG_00910 [Saprolegnia parasitica CBS 223.65]
MRRLQAYWRVVEPTKSAAQIDAETYAVYIGIGPDVYYRATCLRFHRWMLFLAAFVSQICCGSLYAYSLLIKPLSARLGATDEAVSLPYYVAYACVGVAAAVAGPFVERHGPRAAIAVLAVATQSHALLYGYGLLYGSGVGINYVTPIAPLQKWFPDLRGTAAGFALCGFGASGVVWGGVYQLLLRDLGLLHVFVVGGVSMTLLLLVCAIVLRTPPPAYRVHGLDMHGVEAFAGDSLSLVDFAKAHDDRWPELDTTERVYHDRIQHQSLRTCVLSADFVFLYATYMATFVFGIVYLPHFYDLYMLLATSETESDALNFLLVAAICNFLGRLLLPIASDVLIHCANLNPPFGRKLVFGVALGVQSIVLGLLPNALRERDVETFAAMVWGLAVVLGGATGTLPSLCTDLYGVYNTGTMFGILLTGSSLVGLVGGYVFTRCFSAWKHTSELDAYVANVHWVHAVALSGLLFVCLVRTNPVDRFQPGYTLCGRRLCR